jgi:hypothetical protein
VNCDRKSRLMAAAVSILSAVPLGSCTDYIRGAPVGSTITVVANPPFIVAHGGVSVITAIVIEGEIGTPVADGTVVQFFTTLGHIDEQVKTKAGVARANLVADSRSGEAELTVISGGATPETQPKVTIGSANPETVIVVADPAGIKPGQTSYITVNVFDKDGNPVAHVPIVMTLKFTNGSGRDSLESGGRQLFTDSNGQVFDQLHAASSAAGRTVGVKANLPNGVGSDEVPIKIEG